MTFDKQRTRFHNPRTSTGLHGRNTQAEQGLVPEEHSPRSSDQIYQREVTELFKPVRRLQSVTD
jgi:hypothetical protein